MNEDLTLFDDKEEKQEMRLPCDAGWIEDENSTIMSAFIYLTRNTDSKNGMDSRRQMTLDTSDNEALRYLMRRLNMTPLQIHILTCILFHGQSAGGACDTDDMTEYMGSHPLELLSKREEINKLIELGYLEPSESHFGGEQWSVRKEAITALNKNTAFDIETLRSPDTVSFLAECTVAIREGRRYDNNGEIEKKISWLLKLNRHLPITQNINRLAANDALLFKPLVLAASLQCTEGAISIDGDDLCMVMENKDVRRVLQAMRKGTYPLVVKKIFEPLCNDGGMANADKWVISKDGWMELLSQDMEEVSLIMNNNEDWSRNLKPCSQIPERKLFFSGKTEDEVNRLRQLLQDDQYRQVVARLKDKNMPTGLNILLYGTPGTGKTELVQQLARETGRDIFIVDMSQIRDKYVGESEHNLARIFNTYRTYVARMRKTPILFCNECDAIFGSRLERTSGSVDKMENALQNILLEQMEKMQGIMICTTNLTSSLDKAFERRFLLKLQLPRPTIEARKQIWTAMLPSLSDEQATLLANRFDFSGGQIQNVTRKQIINSIFTGSDEMDFNRILDDCSMETMDRSNGHQIGFK